MPFNAGNACIRAAAQLALITVQNATWRRSTVPASTPSVLWATLHEGQMPAFSSSGPFSVTGLFWCLLLCQRGRGRHRKRDGRGWSSHTSGGPCGSGPAQSYKRYKCSRSMARLTIPRHLQAAGAGTGAATAAASASAVDPADAAPTLSSARAIPPEQLGSSSSLCCLLAEPGRSACFEKATQLSWAC